MMINHRHVPCAKPHTTGQSIFGMTGPPRNVFNMCMMFFNAKCHHKPKEKFGVKECRNRRARCLGCEYPTCENCGFQHPRTEIAVHERHKVDGYWFCYSEVCRKARAAAVKA